MASSVQFGVSITPVEEITDENSGTHNVMSSEVGKSLGGSGEATVASYQPLDDDVANQGYLDAAANYKEAPDGAGNEETITDETTASLVFIKNTGYAFSTSTALGSKDSDGRLVKVTTNSGAIILAALAADEAIVLKALQSTATIDASGIKIETVDSDGTENATGDSLAVEYLVVD